MNTNAQSLIPMKIDGKEYCTIQTGLNSKVFRTMDIGKIQAESGWFFDGDGRMEAWNMIGVRENEEGMLFYGPAVKGRPLVPAGLSAGELEKLINLFLALREKQIPYEGFFTPAWFLCDDGRILLLPPALMNFIRKSSPDKIREQHWYPYNHPDLTGCDGLEFTSAVLCCLALKGTHPYAPLEKEEDNRNEQLRHPPLLPPEILIPGLNAESTGIIRESLKKKSEVNLKDWKNLIATWKGESPVRELNEGERADLEKKAADLRNRGEKNRKLRQNWRRRNTVYLTVAIAVIALILFLSGPVRKAMEPPQTIDMSQREVVESYYEGFNTLNQELMEDSIEKKLGKSDIGEVTNFYVTSRVRQGYEGNSGIVTAEDWTRQGRPELEQGKHIYGTVHLKIEDMGSAKFRVNFEKWMPGISDEDEFAAGTVIPPRGYEITDLLTLEKQKKGNWLIVDRDRTVREINFP